MASPSAPAPAPAVGTDAAPPSPPPKWNPVLHNACIAMAVASPLAMLLPPRKMDLRFLLLSGVFSLSTNQLAVDYTGQSIYSRFTGRVTSAFDVSQPEGIRKVQERIREEKAARKARELEQRRQMGSEELQNPGEENALKGATNAAKRVWMGDEKEGWKERRLEYEKKALEEGKGYGDLMMEHIRDAFKGQRSKGKNDEGKGGDSK